MKIKRLLMVTVFFGALVNTYGCSLLKTETKNENEVDIELTIENTEDTEVEEKADFSEGDLFTMFEEINNETVVDFLYDDYNRDGLYEAFVLTRENEDRLWYISADGCEIVQENLGDAGKAQADILAYRIKHYLLLQQEINGRKNTLVYSVDNDNKVSELNISGKGYLYQNQEGELLLQVVKEEHNASGERKDAVYDYYLYYALDEGFQEYGAIPIAEEQFLEFEGAREVLDKIYQEYQEYEVECSFLYRSNHYIHINITLKKDGNLENKHMTLKYDLSGVQSTSEHLTEGKVETAYMLEIATYPTAFRHPN
ncbi:MAG: hypothetical protein HFJ06_08375 [Lachnospiraceae bacterium]|nr:hypothetical protein [Lachnospiraceae bacterium]